MNIHAERRHEPASEAVSGNISLAFYYQSLFLSYSSIATMGKETLLSVEDISKHNSPEDCWVVVDGKVWDLTEFAPEHPGAPDSMYNVIDNLVTGY